MFDDPPEVYPWEYIHRVANEVQGTGIEIKYPPPLFTEEYYKGCELRLSQDTQDLSDEGSDIDLEGWSESGVMV